LNVMLDSGAYSVWKRGEVIDLQSYIDFIHENKQWLDVYVNLDVMGDPVKSWENQREMERQGLSPLPVYHIGEAKRFFDMAMEYDYFGIGGVVFKGKNTLVVNLMKLFIQLCPESNDYKPVKKLHGFGMAVPEIIAQYPWYSVDSASWVIYGRYGNIIMPRNTNGEPDYRKPPWVIDVSTRSTSDIPYDNFGLSPQILQKAFVDYIELHGFKLGKSEFKNVNNGYVLQENELWFNKKEGIIEIIHERGVSNDHSLRDQINVMYYLEMSKTIPEWPWSWKPPRRMGTFFEATE